MNRAILTIGLPGKFSYHAAHEAPATWKEMRKEDLLSWASVISSSAKFRAGRAILAAKLYKIPVKVFKYLRPSVCDQLSDSLEFLFKKNQLLTWLIPSFRHRLMRYYGPKTGLANLTIYEFTQCEVCYEQFQNTKNVEYVDTLAAILYRPRRRRDIDNDIRLPLTTAGYVKRAEKFKKLPVTLKTAIYLNYEGCRNMLHLKYKDAFTGGGSSGAQAPALTPWPKILEAGANDIFGPLQDTKYTNLHEFLSRLCSRIIEGKKYETD